MIKPTSPTLGDLARAALTRHLAAVESPENDMEGIHQRRVATRRLRSALRVFRAALPPRATLVRAELAWLGEMLGAVRDLDVQMAAIGEAASEDVVGPVLGVLNARRAEAGHALDEALASGRYTVLIADLHALLADAEWPAPSTQCATEAAPALIREHAAKFRAAVRRARAHGPARRLHRARIRAKQVRYTLEFFAELYGAPATELIRRLTRAQDVLGAIQDAATFQEQLESLGESVASENLAILRAAFGGRARAARKDVAGALRPLRGGSKRWRRLHQAFEPD